MNVGVHRAGDAMLRREERGDVDAGSAHDINVSFAVAIDALVIGIESNSLAAERGEVLRFQNIETDLHLTVAGDDTMDTPAGHDVVVAGESYALSINIEWKTATVVATFARSCVETYLAWDGQCLSRK